MENDVYKVMKEWSDLINKEADTEDFWLETPIGRFKNPTFIPVDSDDISKISITLKFDEFKDV